MGSKKTTKTNSTTTAAPPSWTMPGITDVAGKVTAALGGLPGQQYTGDFVATPDQNLIDQAVAAYTGASGQAGDLSQYVQGMLPGLEYKPNYSTNLTGVSDQGGQLLTDKISSATHPVIQNLMEQVLPALQSSSLDSGAYSGDRAMAVLPQMALRDSNENAQRIASDLAYQDYTDSKARQLAAYGAETGRVQGDAGITTDRAAMLPSLVDTILRSASGKGDLLTQAAATGQAAQQDNINNALAKDQYALEYPFRGLDIATDLLTRLSGGYGTTTSNSTSVQKTGGLGAIASGVLGAASLASGIGGLGGIGGLLGTAGKAASSFGGGMIMQPFKGMGSPYGGLVG